MTLTPIWRTRIFAAVAAVVAVWLAASVAQGDFMFPLLCAAGIGALLLTQVQPLPLGTLLLGGVLVGYIAGSRGFAQLSLAGNLPLLPAEFVLLASGAMLLVQGAWRRELPFARDTLNVALLLWMAVGVGRLVFDLRTFGFVAVRDFATVYYAAFFFLAQEAGRTAEGRRFLSRCLLGACLFVLVAYPFYLRFPEFFVSYLTLRGVPAILYKGDLVGTMLTFGAVLFFVRFENDGRRGNLVASLVLIAGALATNNRASMVGLGVATLWLAIARRWRFAVVQTICATTGVVLILAAAYAANIPWEKTPVYGLYERVVSIADPLGRRAYESANSVSKGDNNLFRAVWWRAVFDETVAGNPYVGLGFGYDLSDQFVREYYPDPTNEFTTRSPHNILLTVFGRMGIAGLLPFLAIVGAVARHTYRAVRAISGDAAGLWCGAWVIFVSACFGVVLEGPMGAVVFWSALGLANAATLAAREEEETSVAEAADLPATARADEVARTP
ncbi:MAG: O-antigen ligase family protein [Opitutaceae bacterium]